jgi:transposase-like protein
MATLYSLSYCDLEEMMSERDLSVVHTTIFCCVQHFAPEIDNCSRPYLWKTKGIAIHKNLLSTDYVPSLVSSFYTCAS